MIQKKIWLAYQMWW